MGCGETDGESERETLKNRDDDDDDDGMKEEGRQSCRVEWKMTTWS